MKKILVLCFLVAGCASPKEVPVEEFYITNLVDMVCTKYVVTNKEDLKFSAGVDLPLEAGGPCDRQVGVKRQDWNTLKNWIRDRIKDSKEKDKLPWGL